MFGGECSMFRVTYTKIHSAHLLVGKNQKFPTSPKETNPNLLKILPWVKHLSSQVSRHCPAQLQPNAISRQLQCLEEPHLGHPPASVLMPHQTPQTHKSLESMDYILQTPTYQQWQYVSTNIWRPHVPCPPPATKTRKRTPQIQAHSVLGHFHSQRPKCTTSELLLAVERISITKSNKFSFFPPTSC